MRKMKSFAVIGLLSVVAGLPAAAATVVTVPGKANIWLSGMPDGIYSGGDALPANAPTMALAVEAGDKLNFSAIGLAGHTPSPASGPDGSAASADHRFDGLNGISDLIAPFNGLIGVFLSDAPPDSMAAPTKLDFSTAIDRDFGLLLPALQQSFFIGDGRNDGSGAVQSYVVPTGATRLYLGIMDAFGWYDNSGAFEVTITVAGDDPDPAPVPLPAGALLLASGIGMLAWKRKRAG